MEFYGWIIGEGFILMCWPGSSKAIERRKKDAESFRLNDGEFFRFWPASNLGDKPEKLRNGKGRDYQIKFN